MHYICGACSFQNPKSFENPNFRSTKMRKFVKQSYQLGYYGCKHNPFKEGGIIFNLGFELNHGNFHDINMPAIYFSFPTDCEALLISLKVKRKHFDLPLVVGSSIG